MSITWCERRVSWIWSICCMSGVLRCVPGSDFSECYGLSYGMQSSKQSPCNYVIICLRVSAFVYTCNCPMRPRWLSNAIFAYPVLAQDELPGFLLNLVASVYDYGSATKHALLLDIVCWSALLQNHCRVCWSTLRDLRGGNCSPLPHGQPMGLGLLTLHSHSPSSLLAYSQGVFSQRA